jgi:hypothetical protein
MSEAQSTTGILIKRKATTPPASVVITSASAATNSVITTAAPHGRVSKDTVVLAGVTGSTPAVNGTYLVTVLTPTTFSIPLAVTVAGTGGTMTAEFAVVAELTNVDPGGKSRNKKETSTHNEGRESNVLGILRQDDPGATINFVGTDQTHIDVNADIDNNVRNTWQIAFPTGITRTGLARVQKFKFAGAPVDGVQSVEFALAWAGAVTEVLA